MQLVPFLLVNETLLTINAGRPAPTWRRLILHALSLIMLCWLSLALVVATTHAMFFDPSLESKQPADVLHQCQGRAWVRAPDMTPGDVIAGDVKVKLLGPCTDAESYTLGLRYKERIFWKLR